jgi:hypothetical protein
MPCDVVNRRSNDWDMPGTVLGSFSVDEASFVEVRLWKALLRLEPVDSFGLAFASIIVSYAETFFHSAMVRCFAYHVSVDRWRLPRGIQTIV